MPLTPASGKPIDITSPMLTKRSNADRNAETKLAGIDLGMNVKNMRPVQGRSSSKSFHQVSSLKRQKTDSMQYKAVSTEFNIALGGTRQASLVSPNL